MMDDFSPKIVKRLLIYTNGQLASRRISIKTHIAIPVVTSAKSKLIFTHREQILYMQ